MLGGWTLWVDVLGGCCGRIAVVIETLIWMSVYVDFCCLCLLSIMRKQKSEGLLFILGLRPPYILHSTGLFGG